MSHQSTTDSFRFHASDTILSRNGIFSVATRTDTLSAMLCRHGIMLSLPYFSILNTIFNG